MYPIPLSTSHVYNRRRRIGCNDGIPLAPSLSSSISPFETGTIATVLLGGRGGPSDPVDCRPLRCKGGGKLDLTISSNALSPPDKGIDVDSPCPLTLLSWLCCRSLSRTGFFGIGGGALRSTFIDIDTAGDWLEHVRKVTSSLSESGSVSSGRG